MRQLAADAVAVGSAAVAGDSGDPCSQGGAGAYPAGLGAAGLSSSWRYASMVQSTDSDSFSEQAVTAFASPAATPAADGSLPPTATGSPASTPGGEPTAAGRQLWSSPSKRPQMPLPQQQQQPQYAGSTHYPATGAGFPAPHLPPPPGMDPVSYAAGERAAFMLAFQQALPGQQALGQLFSAVDALHSRLEEESRAWRALQLGASKADGLLEATLQRLDALEHSRLPQLQEKWEEVARRAPDQLIELVGSLQQVVALLAQQRQLLVQQRQEVSPCRGAGGPYTPRQLPWLLLAAAGYGQSLLSKADVAVLFLSRKILLTEPPGGELQEGAQGGQPRLRRQISAALGALLFVASVEAAWQAQHRALRPLPAVAQRMAAPLQLGLRAARAAVWSAAMVLALSQTRASCQTAGSSICSRLEAAVAAVKLPTWVNSLARWRRQQQQQRHLEEGHAGALQRLSVAGGFSEGDGVAADSLRAAEEAAIDALPVLLAPCEAAA